MTTLPATQLLGEIEDAIRAVPAGTEAETTAAWVGRAVMLLKQWEPQRSVFFDSHARGTFSVSSALAANEIGRVLMLLHEARHTLRLSEVGPLSVAVIQGGVLDYFEEVRKVLATARRELFFVDPYLDAEFVSRYLPLAPTGVGIRLLGRKGMSALLPAVELASQQHLLSIEVRASPSLHDRFLFVDAARGFQSGASFKDGARFAPAILAEVTDALPSVLSAYETLWGSATIHR